MAGFDIRLPGQIEALADQFDAAGDAMRDMSDLMDSIGMAMETTVEERFAGEHAPDGRPWTPSIRKKVEGGKTLTKSGRLSNSITLLQFWNYPPFTAVVMWWKKMWNNQSIW